MGQPTETAIRLVIQRTASLRHHLGAEIGKRPLVLPNGKYFPDRFVADAPSVVRLMQRLQEHAGMTDVPIQTKLLGRTEPSHGSSHSASAKKKHDCKGDCGGKGCDDCDGSCHDGEHGGTGKPKPAEASHCGTGCGTGCGVPQGLGDAPRIVDQGDSWLVQLHVSELQNPLVLTTTLARTLGYIFLVETQGPGQPKLDSVNELADLASTLLGFGSLLLGGAHIYSKGCGGPRVVRTTVLSCQDLAFATVLFSHWQQHDLRPLQRELEVTQSAAINDAIDWLKARPSIVERFVNNPESLARGDIPMEPASRGLFSRLFGKRSEPRPQGDDPMANLDELEALLASAPPPTKTRQRGPSDPKADELRALVDEAFADPGS